MKCCESVKGADCHCGKCHETFSSLRLFDKHQDVNYKRTPPVLCYAPVTLGMARDHGGTWTTPEAVISRQVRALAMAERARNRKRT